MLQRRTGAHFWQMIVGRSLQNNRSGDSDHHRFYHRRSRWIRRRSGSPTSLGMGVWRARSDSHISLLSGIEHHLESRTAPASTALAGGPIFCAWSTPVLYFGQFVFRLYRYLRIGPYLGSDDALIRGLHTASDRA